MKKEEKIPFSGEGLGEHDRYQGPPRFLLFFLTQMTTVGGYLDSITSFFKQLRCYGAMA
jgi:hypothetical protein